ncbi:MAG: YHS domain-containing protein, partial [Propionibacteriaceae bacterium]
MHTPWGYSRIMTSAPHQDHPGTSTALVRDPVCGMDVDPAAAGPRSEHLGATHHFCSEHCRAKFDADPAAYTHEPDQSRHSATPAAMQLGEVQAAVMPTGDDVEYTCPMHPEIRQSGPGACPICGMALEPVVVTADTGPSAM